MVATSRSLGRAPASGDRSCPLGQLVSVTGGSDNQQQWQRRHGIGWEAVADGWRRGKTEVTAAARQQ